MAETCNYVACDEPVGEYGWFCGLHRRSIFRKWAARKAGTVVPPKAA